MYAAQLVIIIPLTKYRSDSPEPSPSVVSILSLLNIDMNIDVTISILREGLDQSVFKTGYSN